MKNVPQMIRKMGQSLLRRAHPSANGSIAERCRSHLCELYSRQQSHGSDLVLNNLVAWATATGRIHLKSDGSAWRPLVHASDVARAYVAALEAPREAVHDQAFNVGRSDQNFTIRQLASMIEAALPGARIEFAGGAGPDTRNYRVSCDKIARLLPAYRPLWTVAEGIRELVEGFRDRGLDVETFEGHRFNRLAHLRWLIDRGLLDRELRWRDAA